MELLLINVGWFGARFNGIDGFGREMPADEDWLNH
jgi:hypothetical protein